MNASSIRSAAEARPAHAITADVVSVRLEVDALEKQIEELESKLGPVLRPQNETQARSAMEPKAVHNRSQLGTELEDLSVRVSAVRSRLARMTDAAEIA